jgi:hypothetical protein
MAHDQQHSDHAPGSTLTPTKFRTLTPSQRSQPDECSSYNVFLSYHAPDRAAVAQLVARLKQAGLHPWFDQDEILTGQIWMDCIEQGMRHAQAVAVIIGAGGLGPWQRHEAYAAMRLALSAREPLPVIPVLLPGADRDGLPLLLDNFAWVEFRTSLDDEGAFERLVRGITGGSLPMPRIEPQRKSA